MSFTMPRLQGAGKSLHRAVMKVSLLPARYNQMTLDFLSTGPAKLGLIKFLPGYGKAIAFLVDPLREMHELALKKHERMAAGQHPGSLKQHLTENYDIIRRHLPAFKQAYQAQREQKAAKTSTAALAPAPALG